MLREADFIMKSLFSLGLVLWKFLDLNKTVSLFENTEERDLKIDSVSIRFFQTKLLITSSLILWLPF